MINILTIIAPLFLIIFTTAIVQKFKKVSDNWSVILNKFALNIGFPVLIFTALAKTPFSFKSEADLIITNSIFIFMSFLLALIVSKILKLKKKMTSTLFISFAFGNVAYLGMPVLTETFGQSQLSTASIIVAIYLFWIFTIGIGYLDYSIDKNKKNAIKNIFKNFFKNPLLISVILGLIVGNLKLDIPVTILKSLNMISASATPIVLIVIGLFIGTSKIGKISEWFPALLFSLVTLAILPAIFYFGTLFFGYEPQKFSSSIIDSAMPLAITPFALADKYKLDKTFIAHSIVLSTILSAITLPIWISIIQ